MTAKDRDSEIRDLHRRVALLEKQAATIVAELRARKVLPPAPPGKKVTVRMSPNARIEQRRRLLAEAREKRWSTPAPIKNPAKKRKASR